jgi:arylamine N-acetyltransferase
MINIVTIGDNRYLVDVGFGSNYCAIQPLRLIHDTTGSENVAPASVRLVWKSIAGSENQLQKLWVYQHRIGPEKEFQDMYCFTEIEFRHRDFEVMNWSTSTNPKAFFTQRVVCNKMLSGGDKGEKIVGVLTLQKDLKRRIGADTEHIEEFKTETDRVRALEEHFNIRLSTFEQEAIRGTVAEV